MPGDENENDNGDDGGDGGDSDSSEWEEDQASGKILRDFQLRETVEPGVGTGMVDDNEFHHESLGRDCGVVSELLLPL